VSQFRVLRDALAANDDLAVHPLARHVKGADAFIGECLIEIINSDTDHQLLPSEPEVLGLLALTHFHEARRIAQIDDRGNAVLLDDQDRAQWDAEHIRMARGFLERALAREAPGPYQIQAAISAVHVDAAASDDTDWDQIVALYWSMRRAINSPIVELNHAVAVAKSTGALSGLAMVDAISGLDKYPYFHAARATFLAESGSLTEARAAFKDARDASTSMAQRRFFTRKVEDLS
jgi:RNA polymerase sigma-70 factor (ECF subfamily)